MIFQLQIKRLTYFIVCPFHFLNKLFFKFLKSNYFYKKNRVKSFFSLKCLQKSQNVKTNLFGHSAIEKFHFGYSTK